MSKEYGVLGIKRPSLTNEAFLFKILWNLMTNLNNIWSRILINKYDKSKKYC